MNKNIYYVLVVSSGYRQGAVAQRITRSGDRVRGFKSLSRQDIKLKCFIIISGLIAPLLLMPSMAKNFGHFLAVVVAQ